LSIKLANLSWSHFTSCLSSSFFSPKRESYVSTTTFSLQDGEQDSSIKSMQEVEASTLELGIAQEIDDSSRSKELLVLVSVATPDFR
jgi:hypothetical protein